jgi:hypothetical protein
MVETCCCGCCSVETGTIIIAVLDIVSKINIILFFEKQIVNKFGFWIWIDQRNNNRDK